MENKIKRRGNKNRKSYKIILRNLDKEWWNNSPFMKNKKNGLFNKEDRKKLNIKMRLKDYGK